LKIGAAYVLVVAAILANRGEAGPPAERVAATDGTDDAASLEIGEEQGASRHVRRDPRSC
jgi:hypothetical protein